MHNPARALLLAAILLGAQPALDTEIVGRVVGVTQPHRAAFQIRL
jgi:hypothetical protein